jgi:hypothetical protein
VEGTNLDLPGLQRAPASLSELGFPTTTSPENAPAFLRSGSRVVRVDTEQLAGQPDRDPASTPAEPGQVATGWSWLAAASGGTELAAVGGDRAQLARWQGATQLPVPALGSRLSPPTYDRRGFLWVAGVAEGRGQLWVLDSGQGASAVPQVVAVDWLEGRVVVGQRVADDGQRVAVVSVAAAGGDPRVDVAGVVRSATGAPERLAEPLRAATPLTLVRDLVWVDDTTLALLGRISSQSPVRVWTAGVGGRLQAAEAADVPGARSITTTNGERGLVLTTDDHRVLLRAGSSWIEVAEGTDFAVPAT